MAEKLSKFVLYTYGIPDLFFALMVALAFFFFVRSWKDGYWGKDAEEVKYQMFHDGEQDERRAS